MAGAIAKLDPAVDEGARVAGNLLQRLLGPSADVIGQDWAAAISRRNLQRLLKKTEARSKGENPGIVPPRVASQVFEAAQYADAELISEYLSGILASSRDGQGSNDAGVSWSSLVSRLSSDQVRLHYLFYASMREATIIAGVERASELHGKDALLPLQELVYKCDFGVDVKNRLSDAIDGLMREDLISDSYGYGSIEQVEQLDHHPGKVLHAPFDRAMRFGMTIHGIRLCVWGLGQASLGTDAYSDGSVNMELVDAELLPSPIVVGGFYDDFLIPETTD